jgi:hypothetical protein
MRPTIRHRLCLGLILGGVMATNYGAINHDAEPYVISMVNNASVGLDG